MHIEFDARFQCEAYPRPNENPPSVLKRGDFSYFVPILLRWRTYELDDGGEPSNFGEWQDAQDIAIAFVYALLAIATAIAEREKKS